MSLVIPPKLATQSSHPLVVDALSGWEENRGEPILVPSGEVSDDLLTSLIKDAGSLGMKSYCTQLKAIVKARAGEFRSIPGRFAMSECLLAYLNHDAIDGWLYNEYAPGRFQPLRVVDVTENRGGSVSVFAKLLSVGTQDGTYAMRVDLDSTRGLPATVLHKVGLVKESAALKKSYQEDECHFRDLVSGRSGRECLLTGEAFLHWSYVCSTVPTEKQVDSPLLPKGRKVVMESTLNTVITERFAAVDSGLDSLGEARIPLSEGSGFTERVPVFLGVEVFDLTGEETLYVHTSSLTAYVYDATLRERLILPAHHAKIIDALTARTDSFLTDMIYGKTSGNMILCKGRPGVGKTLTAEVVSETLERPLYVVDTSSLLAPAAASIYTASHDGLRNRLDKIFQRVRRWDAVLLFDEADVLLGERNDDLERNRITGELLRMLEQFEGLAFLTTNRPDDIDDAILSRCVAIIHYAEPEGEDAVRAWLAMAEIIEVGLTEADARTLTALFPRLSPREIKQLLRLSKQVSSADGRALDVEVIKECSVFRGL